jgi:ribosomal protein L37AE/L43A
MSECPMCGTEQEQGEDSEIYTCPQCGNEGMICCIAGKNCICCNCEQKED